MHILFVADPLSSFKIYKDTTFAMMREAQRRGHQVLACEPQDIVWQSGQQVTARVQQVRLTGLAEDWFDVQSVDEHYALKSADAIVMRKDPPFDSEYFYATHLLEQKVDIRVIQVMLGHKKLETTALYTQVATEVLKEVINPLETLPTK